MRIPDGKKLGSLCKRGHRWEGRAQSLRYEKGGACVECKKDPEFRAKQNARNRERRKDPEVRAKEAERMRERWKDPELRAKQNARRRERMKDPEVRAKDAERRRERYRKDPEARAKQAARQIEYQRERRRIDEAFAIKCRLRARLGYWMNGKKLKSACEYGVDYQAIIDHLGPCPGKREDYHIDHIIPLSHFDHTDPEQIKKAWAPENHQWLTAEENIRKGDKMPCEI